MELFPLGVLCVAYTITYATTLYAIENGRLPNLIELVKWVVSTGKARELFALLLFSAIILLMGFAGLLACGYKGACSINDSIKGALVGVSAMVVGLRLLLHSLLYNEESRNAKSNLIDLINKIKKIGMFPSGPPPITYMLKFFECCLIVLVIIYVWR